MTFCASFYPALCDVTGFLHGRAGGWPRFFDKYKLVDVEQQKAVEAMQYYDVVNFGRLLHCPTFLSYGYADNTCSPTSVAALQNSITVPLTPRFLMVAFYSGLHPWANPLCPDDLSAQYRHRRCH